MDHSSSDLQNKKIKTSTNQTRNATNYSYKSFFYKCLQLILIVAIQIFILQNIFQAHHQPPKPQQKIITINPPPPQRCRHGMVYVYDLPPMFNQDLLRNCRDLDPWHSRCNAISNHGFGPKAERGPRVSNVVPENLSSLWYWTDMFAGEVLYHARILRHECRTIDPESASAYYIPFYAGLAIGKYLFSNHIAEKRDRPCVELLEWVGSQPWFKKSNRSDHFIMLGRMTWDFRRTRDGDWGSSFLHMPAMKRVVRLGVERDPWDPFEISVPYPTGFHPRTKSDVDRWVEFVRGRKRTSLFAFVGGKRNIAGDFRTVLSEQCRSEPARCRSVDCSGTKCHDGTWEILEAFLGSDFCLQPRGDAHTRRSTFDCMLAGSIPVFFWARSIQKQYEWFLGDEPEKFSVFVDRREVRNGTSVRRVLEGFSRSEVEKLRARVISLIPRFVYRSISDNDSFNDDDEDGSFEDAFDVAINGVLRRFEEQNRVKNV